MDPRLGKVTWLSRFRSQNGQSWQEEDCLPLGWTFTPVARPNGIVMGHLHEAEGTQEEVETMQKFMLKEGWFTTEFLPPGF